jgi:hypothetical protein
MGIFGKSKEEKQRDANAKLLAAQKLVLSPPDFLKFRCALCRARCASRCAAHKPAAQRRAVEMNQQIPSTLKLTNPTSEYIGFKVRGASLRVKSASRCPAHAHRQLATRSSAAACRCYSVMPPCSLVCTAGQDHLAHKVLRPPQQRRRAARRLRRGARSPRRIWHRALALTLYFFCPLLSRTP